MTSGIGDADQKQRPIESRRRPSKAATGQKTPLDTATYATVKALQKRCVGMRPRQLAKVPLVFGHLEDGTPIALKLLPGRRHPDTGLHHYLIMSQSSAELLTADGLADKVWRYQRIGEHDVIRIIAGHESIAVARAIWTLMHTGERPTRRDAIVLKNRNALDLRSANVHRVQSNSVEQRRLGKATPEKTDLAPETYARVKSEQERILAKTAAGSFGPWSVKEMAAIPGRLADGSEVEIVFVSGRRHPDTGQLRYAILDRGMTQRLADAGYGDHCWSLSHNSKGSWFVKLSWIDSPSALRTIYELETGQKVPRHMNVANRGDNPLDARISELEPRPSLFKRQPD